MGTLSLGLSAGLLFAAGRHVERAKSVKLTKIDLLFVGIIEIAGGLYFMVAGVGQLGA